MLNWIRFSSQTTMKNVRSRCACVQSILKYNTRLHHSLCWFFCSVRMNFIIFKSIFFSSGFGSISSAACTLLCEAVIYNVIYSTFDVWFLFFFSLSPPLRLSLLPFLSFITKLLIFTMCRAFYTVQRSLRFFLCALISDNSIHNRMQCIIYRDAFQRANATFVLNSLQTLHWWICFSSAIGSKSNREDERRRGREQERKIRKKKNRDKTKRQPNETKSMMVILVIVQKIAE